MEFYVGLHLPHQAGGFRRSFISINRLRKRKSAFPVGEWIMDSGAFTEISTYGGYRSSVEEYAAEINRWKHVGKQIAAVSQDYMCEAFILAKTGLSVLQHQLMTISRYAKLQPLTDVYVMPVLQGYEPQEYVQHIRMYEAAGLLPQGAWIGVGSICKRNKDPRVILAVLEAIHTTRPDLRLHGFGLKLTALASPAIRAHLHTADSMAWSFAARMEKNVRGKGGGANCANEAQKFVSKIQNFLLHDY